MIDIYLVDRIDIIDDARDEWGASTPATQADVKARVEDKNKLVKGQDGTDVMASMKLWVDKSAVITYKSRIQFKKQTGSSVTLVPGKTYPIKKLDRVHGFTDSHWEVWL